MRKVLSLATLFFPLLMFSSCSSSSISSKMCDPTDGQWTWDGTIQEGRHTVVLCTSKGDITLELDADLAPKTVTNFLALSSSGYYDNLTFHRVIPGFMIQGGDPTGNGTGGHSIFGGTFEDEINAASPLYREGYKKGTLAMANRGENTNSSQFFIMAADRPLPPLYTIFGHVTSGQDIVDAIVNVPQDKTNNKPLTKVIFKAKVLK